jgi:hypothetical protein
MESKELVQYITDGIINHLDRNRVEVPSEAADDLFQLAVLRQYVARESPSEETPEQSS